ncbi:MAG: T9SS type A sorting domain-containing protein [Ignavibacteriales bacterium]|nr:T9SS type A sorting domain-containing protein [Ignavibacteriales bacterium]
MVVDGSIRSAGSVLPSTALIRILHSDSSVAKTISLYDPYKGKFGARLSTTDGFEEDERILFRVVLSSRDSFFARSVAPVVFKGTELPFPAPNVTAEIFRNHIPQLRRLIPDTTVNENQLLRYRPVAIDLDGDTILFRLVKGPPSARMDSITGLLTWRPGFGDAGVHEIVFTAEDRYDVAVSKAAYITVTNVNRPPLFTNILPDTVIREGQTLRFHVRANDPDEDHIRFSQTRIPAGAVFDSVEGFFEWTPTFEQTGEYIFTLSVLDEHNAGASRTSRVTVLNVNRPPVFTNSAPDTSVDEEENLNFQIAAIDPDGNDVTFSLVSAPHGAVLSPQGYFLWKPTYQQAGDHEITVRVQDDSLESDRKMFIHVANVNRLPTPPHLVRPAPGDTVNVNNGRPVVFTWRRSFDVDTDDTLSYTLQLKGEFLDTTISGIRDSSLSLNVRSRLRPASRYSVVLSVSDGSAVVAAESLPFRTSGATPPKESTSLASKSFSLEHNYPNPFNPVTSIRYTIPERSFVKLTVWNMLGELVQELVAEEKDTGIYETTFKAERLPSGVYLVKLEAHPVEGLERKDFISTKKMILVK